jgi:outer membrane protein OmpA-like peptidoglycan-associated protein
MRKSYLIVILVFFALLTYLSWNWYKSTVLCCDEQIDELEVEDSGPLTFDCENSKVITGKDWPEHKSKILSEQSKDKKLMISTPYFNGEEQSAGINRANLVAELFKDNLSNDQIILAQHQSGDCAKSKSIIYHDSKFKWVVRNEKVIEDFDHSIIYYKYNSDEEVIDEHTADFFKNLADFLIANPNDQISIIGHTDDVGSDKFNEELGLKRVKEYESHLTKLGVKTEQIIVVSKGRSEPIADNSTEEGRQKNRRVEIRIVEK